MRAVSRGLRRHFPWNDRVWLVRGGAVALSPKRIAAICRSTSLLQGTGARLSPRNTQPETEFRQRYCVSMCIVQIVFCGYPHPQSTEWENLHDVCDQASCLGCRRVD